MEALDIIEEAGMSPPEVFKMIYTPSIDDYRKESRGNKWEPEDG